MEMYSGSHRALMIINVSAPESKKHFEEYERFMLMRGRRRAQDAPLWLVINMSNVFA